MAAQNELRESVRRMIFYDLEPPPFSVGGQVAAAARPVAATTTRTKNPSRAASEQFTEPVRLAVRLADGAMGHYNTDTQMFWQQTARAGQELPVAEVNILAPKEVAIPPGVLCGDLPCPITSDTCFDFLDFTVPATSPPILTVGCPLSDVHALTELLAEVEAQVEILTNPCPPPFQPSAHFTAAVAAHKLEVVFVLVSRGSAPEISHRLCSKGWYVSVLLQPGDATPKIRVQASLLRWVKDCEVDHALSKFADSMPGMAPITASSSPARCLLTWDDVVYNDDMNVPRSMMSWGMLAAWLAKGSPTSRGFSHSYRPFDLNTICEPLASYMKGVLEIQERRNSGCDEDAEPVLLLQWNSPQKMTSEQCGHAAALFYWCAMHKDDASRPLPKSVCKRSLELYLRFGYVFLRKRAYQFHSGKRRREGKEDDVAEDAGGGILE
jgi:hypothetical protein